MSDAGYRQVEHTADLAFELWGPDQAALLDQGTRAVVEVMTGGPRPQPAQMRTIDLEVVDDEDRLVRWLNELLYLAAIDGFLVAEATFDLSDAGRLRATVRGDTDTAVEDEIKSATYHDLVIERDGPRLRATVVLDV
jgi:SHS2 domain-containing protein